MIWFGIVLFHACLITMGLGQTVMDPGITPPVDTNLNSTMNNINNTMNNMNNTMDNMNNTMGNMNNTMVNMNSTMNNMNNTMGSMNSTMGNMNNTMNNMNNTMNNMNNTMVNMNNTMGNMNNTMNNMNNTMGNMKSTMNNMNNTMGNMNSTMNNMNDTMNNMNNTMNSMNITMANMNYTMNSMNMTMNSMNETMNNMMQAMMDMNKTMNNMNAMKNNINNNIDPKTDLLRKEVMEKLRHMGLINLMMKSDSFDTRELKEIHQLWTTSKRKEEKKDDDGIIDAMKMSQIYEFLRSAGFKQPNKNEYSENVSKQNVRGKVVSGDFEYPGYYEKSVQKPEYGTDMGHPMMHQYKNRYGQRVAEEKIFPHKHEGFDSFYTESPVNIKANRPSSISRQDWPNY